MAGPTLRDVLDAVNYLATGVDRLTTRMDQLEDQMGRLEIKFDELQGVVVQGFASLNVREARRTGTGGDD